jgi:mannose/cellobiose epimerase-like protein (N-acyl-D-glucosamine 2-epimerase family)
MIPVSQRYFTHSDGKAIKDSMAHPPDQKLLKNTNAMMIDTMQAAQAVRNKPMPEIEAQIEKTAAGASQPALTQLK